MNSTQPYAAASDSQAILAAVDAQRRYFKSQATLSLDFRKAMLRRLHDGVKRYTKPLTDALHKDLNKSYQEAYITEIATVLAEIKSLRRNLKRWSAPERVSTPWSVMPARSSIITEPLGVSLIIAPWNYPVQLLLSPLAGAIAAGCTAVLKPSPYTPNVAKVLETMIKELFNSDYITIFLGDRYVNQMLLKARYDVIFFTGSAELGRVVMRAAAEHLTPVVLELGGKSPVVVDASANVDLAARRVAWGKTLNAGQTCIAPDYVLVHKDVKEHFISSFRTAILELHGEDVQRSKHYGRMISDKAFSRVAGYIAEGRVRCGGEYNAQTRYIAPTLLDYVEPNAKVLQEEVFGPVLPIIPYETIDEAIAYINRGEKPLALYIFADKPTAKEVLGRTTAGGSCVNDVIMHIVNPKLPFGGVGNSGMGRYHGKASLYAFSNRRSVLSASTKLDLPFRYMPYRWFWIIKHLL